MHAFGVLLMMVGLFFAGNESGLGWLTFIFGLIALLAG
jgi:hypothetical protein